MSANLLYNVATIGLDTLWLPAYYRKAQKDIKQPFKTSLLYNVATIGLDIQRFPGFRYPKARNEIHPALLATFLYNVAAIGLDIQWLPAHFDFAFGINKPFLLGP